MTAPADSAVEVLRELQWSGRSYLARLDESFGSFLARCCPICDRPDIGGNHAPDCRLHKALTAPATAGQADEVAELRAKWGIACATADRLRDIIDRMIAEKAAAEARATTAEAERGALRVERDRLSVQLGRMRDHARRAADYARPVRGKKEVALRTADWHAILDDHAALQADGGRAQPDTAQDADAGGERPSSSAG